MLKEYLENIAKTFKIGDATEESYYFALRQLLEDYLESKNKQPSITVVARKTKIGKPDFTVRNGKELIGNIEAKDITCKDLSELHDSPQIKRYLTLPNFIFTNFLDFQLFRDGKLVQEVRIGQPAIINKLKTAPPPQNEDKFIQLLDTFLSYNIPEVKSEKLLAKELAQRAKLLTFPIVEELNNQETTEIDRIYDSFKKYLIADLSKEDFADIYAQTITYGLFTARLQYRDKGFNRHIAADLIPKKLHVFHDTFSLISGAALPESLEWIVDDIAGVLAHCDIEKIRKDLHREKAGGDPIMHFYETFLAEYDPKKREACGVYYTPLPVVSYITRSVNILLKEKFAKKNGFADKSVTLLDPAAGTLTFLANAILLVKEEIDKGNMAGGWQQVVKGHILKNFYAFELLMAPYIIGHLKTSLLLEDLGYKSGKDDPRFPLYLTNTLDLRDVAQVEAPYVAALSKEAIDAKKIKSEVPILAIMGNPPYSGHSKNIGEWITNLIEDYKKVDGRPLGERNPKWLQDDYVKFIRFSQWKIEKAGQGILAFITNHSYLDNPTFRGMRQSLMQTFNEIYILDLHGNSLKKETCPDGSKDENVFDIQQGVAIAFFIKEQGKKTSKVFHSDLWGLREKKYNWLDTKDVKSTKWELLNPKSEMYFFVHRDEKEEAHYQSFAKITEIFPVNSVGIVTSRDNLVFDFDKQALKRRIETLRRKELSDEIVKATYNLEENARWKISKAREELRKIEDFDEYFVECLYRPFDIRYLFYHDAVIERSRKEVMQHMLQENLGIITSRQAQSGFRHALIANRIADLNSTGTAGKYGSGYLFPFYLYSDKDKEDLFSGQKAGQRKPNINSELYKIIFETYKAKISPEEIFYYIYAILYSNTYRQKYQEFLKIDFPRIPFTKDYELFKKIAVLGKELADTHLLKSKKLDKSIAKFPAQDGCKVEKREYKEKEQKLYINDKQYFSGVTKEVWDYYIGGYQVLDKWLKERQGRILSDDDIAHLLKVITSLSLTIELQKEIDKLYPLIEKRIIEATL